MKSSFDRSFLPDADFEFIVIGDTHYILDPEPYAIEFTSVRQWPQRAAKALELAAGLEPEFVVHLGDLTEENPAKPGHAEARRRALNQIEAVGLAPKYVAGNMDIGDKPDPTMWSEWVTPQTLATFHRQFGRSWYGFSHGNIHCVILNSQILNSALAEARAQQQWFEAELAAQSDKRIFVFMHMPPFFVDEQEPDTGFYNSIDQPARSWLTALLRRHKVELFFAGHTHFRAFNRIGPTRFYIAPSTTTSRAGFYEAFSVAPPPEQGRNDTAKLGFYLVRVNADSARVHLVRSKGETELAQQHGQRLLTRTSHELERSPLGVNLRTPLAFQSEGALAWPSVLRQRVRDDHPFLACLELGARHVRVPCSDLDNDLQRQRLALLRDEGIEITASWLWSERLQLALAAGRHQDSFDTLELQVPATLWPTEACLDALSQCGQQLGKPVVLTPILAREKAGDKYHPRTRFGYRADELAHLDCQLAKKGLRLDRVLCHLDPKTSPWEEIQTFGQTLPLDQIDALDFVVSLPGTDSRTQTDRTAEAVFAASQQPGCRLFLDPFVDLDRTNDINHGLLDRLSNPRAAFHVAQCLNTILFSQPQPLKACGKESPTPTLEGKNGHYILVPSQGLAGFDKDCDALFDLANCTSRYHIKRDELNRILTEPETPYLLFTANGEH